MTLRRYLTLWLMWTALLLLVVAGFNLAVDPYGLFRLLESPAFNAVKPTAGTHGEMVKAYQVLRVRPRGLILGNSRAEVGFDPQHPAWPQAARPVFNLALPGTGTATTVNYLRHVLANGAEADKPVLAVWGIDFMDFLVDAGAPVRARPAGREAVRLFVNPDGSRNARWALQRLRDYAEATFSLAALLDSAQTVASQGDPYAADLTPLGFNPMRDYLKITATEGYWSVFRQRDLENIKAYLRRPRDIYDAAGRSSPALDDLRQVLRLCRRHGIRLHLVIYPYHAHLLEIIRLTGHWPAFEVWQRAVVQIVAEEARAAGAEAAPLWDFSTFDALTGEAVPAQGDRRTRMRGYWEAGHFKHELGDRVLQRVLAGPLAQDGFGVRLGPDNVEARIAARRTEEARYRQQHGEEVADLERLVGQMRGRR